MRHNLTELALCTALALMIIVPAGVLGAPQNAKKQAEKEWTLLMFWDADNSLEFCTEYAFDVWESALTSNDKVNIIAYVDILSEEGVWIYEVLPGGSELVATWSELDSGDPASLERFVVYGMGAYPAKKTMLVVQDHGFGWRGICKDETVPGYTLMPIDGLGDALRAAEEKTGRGIDLLAFDACNMATIEVVYELRDVAPYFVASETTVPFDGLPYEMFITDLMEEPTLDARSLAVNIVYEYVEFYSSKTEYAHIYPYSQEFATICAVDMSMVDELGARFIELSQSLEPLVAENRELIQDARGYALMPQWASMAGYEWMPDVLTLVEGLTDIQDEGLQDAIAGFREAYQAAVIAEDNSDRVGPVPTGLNFWFPPSLAQYYSKSWVWAQQFVYHEMALDLVTESAWYDCLMEYFTSEYEK